MKLTNLLSFANIIYDSNKLFNSVKRKNENMRILSNYLQPLECLPPIIQLFGRKKHSFF